MTAFPRNAVVRECWVDGIVCPKPRRIGLLETISPTPRLPHSNSDRLVEVRDTSGRELVDIIPMKKSKGLLVMVNQQHNVPSIFPIKLGSGGSNVASSPTFFTGSPPSRASNPIVEDEQFVYHNAVKPNSPHGCSHVNFRPKPTPVRVEGFNCRGCRISVVA